MLDAARVVGNWRAERRRRERYFSREVSGGHAGTCRASRAAGPATTMSSTTTPRVPLINISSGSVDRGVR